MLLSWDSSLHRILSNNEGSWIITKSYEWPYLKSHEKTSDKNKIQYNTIKYNVKIQ